MESQAVFLAETQTKCFSIQLPPSLLMEVRATDTNIMEVKTVAGFVSYKICKLAFRLNLPRDAISQFRKHMDIFQQKVGMDGEWARIIY